MEVGKTNTVAQQISVEEYDKQKSEYTQNALKELREQMRNIENNYENPKKKIQKIIPESDNESDNNIKNLADIKINWVVFLSNKPGIWSNKVAGINIISNLINLCMRLCNIKVTIHSSGCFCCIANLFNRFLSLCASALC